MSYDFDPNLTFDLVTIIKNVFSRKLFQRLHALFDFNQTWSKGLAGQWLQKLSHGFDLKVDPGSQGSNKAKTTKKFTVYTNYIAE